MKSPIKYIEGQRLLYTGTVRAIFFNVCMATLLAGYLFVNKIPVRIIVLWLLFTLLISITRMVHCKLSLKKQLYITRPIFNLRLFLILTAISALVWTNIYFMSRPYSNEASEFVILLVFCGMCTGAASTLAVYMPALFAYTFSIFLPVIIYQYSLWQINNAILGTMFVFVLFGVGVIAKAYHKMLTEIFFLTEENKILLTKFEKLSITDPLTGLYNRRHFTEMLEEEYQHIKNNKHSFTIISIDVDNFKLINDNLGHPFGDKFLIYIANYLRYYFNNDHSSIFRVGGDEFVVLILNSTEEYAKSLCDKIKSEFQKTPKFAYKPHDNHHKKILAKVSLSIGSVYVSNTTSNISEIVERVDRLLYEAKHAVKKHKK